ncbi:DNA invertase Pin-like site-specific DNA recombinase [Anaerosolibacter carboniphilus]|uniref:DNA invertase Pin-like site-specific DNA recombinase n=1 Tax=Anaerosolibacter carboniphilus TaxID=1417629 RepID=A0A841KL22_9FIRM|nr:recombinase family protein [Anaerosolibacter carboniphilus]MBB6214113.1 DNA invertase Pin-like site-specific DNA recombinase [Anaerosolibacter carboniphilus]
MELKIKNVVGYARISTESQKDNTSIHEQIKRIKAYCISQNWNLINIFYDEAKSGSTTDEREQYNKMLEFISDEQSSVNAIVVFKADRIHRNLKNLLIMIEDELEPYEIAFISVSESFDTSTPQGMLILQMLGSFAEFEKNLINERTKTGRLATAREGKYAGGKIPFGYEVKDSKYLVKEDEAKIIKTIFKMYSEGKSYRYIAEHLNNTSDITGDSSGCSRAYPKRWSRTSICYILTNSTYIGVMTYDGRKEKNRIKNTSSIPSIISKPLFNKVQKLRKEK